MSVFGNRKVAAAVRTKEDFEIALLSRVDVIFLLYSSILTMKAYVENATRLERSFSYTWTLQKE